MNLIVALLATAVTLSPADIELLKKPYSKLTPAEKVQYDKANELRFIIEDGGEMNRPGTPAGKIRFFNCTKSVDTSKLAKIGKSFDEMMHYDVAIEDCDRQIALANAVQTRKELKADLAVFIISDAALSALTVLPDDGVALVNAARLGDATTKPPFLAARVRKECLRAFAYLTAGSTYGTPLFARISDPSQFDDIAGESYPVDLMMRAQRYLSPLGFEPRQTTTYREALESGFDIAPTNDYQKAIYEKVKKSFSKEPSNPLKITK